MPGTADGGPPGASASIWRYRSTRRAVKPMVLRTGGPGRHTTNAHTPGGRIYVDHEPLVTMAARILLAQTSRGWTMRIGPDTLEVVAIADGSVLLRFTRQR